MYIIIGSATRHIKRMVNGTGSINKKNYPPPTSFEDPVSKTCHRSSISPYVNAWCQIYKFPYDRIFSPKSPKSQSMPPQPPLPIPPCAVGSRGRGLLVWLSCSSGNILTVLAAHYYKQSPSPALAA